MPNWWLAVGAPEHWQIAFEHGNIWGLRATPKLRALWERLSDGDGILFYATSPVSGIIGYGVVRTKFKQDKPLWPQEIREERVIWYYRFEFDVTYCLSRGLWESGRVVSKRLVPRGGFQPVSEEVANEIVRFLPYGEIKIEEKPPSFEKKGIPVHEDIKQKLLEIGRLQKLIAETEYDVDGGKLDVVWRRVERGSPTYVFEVQVGGDLYHAIGKLKHASDLWNSNIFLVATKNDVAKAQELLSGTFHEIRGKIRIIEAEKINELFKLKKAYRDFESQLGIS
jgi:hypothetical protein